MAFKTREKRRKVTSEMESLLRSSGHADYHVAMASQRSLAELLQKPFNDAILHGSLTDGVFDSVDFGADAPVEFPLDPVGPGEDQDFIAYSASPTGKPNHRVVTGDSMQLDTVEVRNSIDISRRYAKRARWDVLSRVMKVAEAGHIMKDNLDGFSTVIAALMSRNFIASDASVTTAGVLSPKLIAKAKTKMRRLGGGNTASLNRYKLTDILMSVEAGESVLGWTLSDVDEYTLRQIIISNDDTGIKEIFGVSLHTIDELGPNQVFEDLYVALGGTHQANKRELLIGLDLESENTFVKAIREDVKLYEDPTAHRSGMISLYSEADRGFGSLNNRGVIGLEV